ncbi:hypothetical protein D3C86_1785010 [compost metagenome]
MIGTYAAYIEKQQEERVTGLLYILKAANKYNFDVDDVLQQFKQDIEETINVLTEGRYSRKLAMDRHANLLVELAQYLLGKQDYDNGLKFLEKAMKDYEQINREKYKMLAVTANILQHINSTGH